MHHRLQCIQYNYSTGASEVQHCTENSALMGLTLSISGVIAHV